MLATAPAQCSKSSRSCRRALAWRGEDFRSAVRSWCSVSSSGPARSFPSKPVGASCMLCLAPAAEAQFSPGLGGWCCRQLAHHSSPG
ncbi:hypothetical protein CHLRE_12g529376v5 [Chlamydomonas reinhardtii]|uniref:Uncharacterized protein n=1 Tax=Chlamydomonas reinhardtii TaxID=3055 RepID=A0A2K3D4P6_CHLRE|nr:uncharacterized protein CHLRE_12g529376v5 [Chlamydomonas reinhardtii]PNW75503.1 hypothetical protein CHLRE_12g529376v5 [Chlamydomonas reinhardtii]